jgi:hypothetical protein
LKQIVIKKGELFLELKVKDKKEIQNIIQNARSINSKLLYSPYAQNDKEELRKFVNDAVRKNKTILTIIVNT